MYICRDHKIANTFSVLRHSFIAQPISCLILSSLPTFNDDHEGLIIVLQASLYSISIFALKLLSLSNNVGGLEPSFFKCPLCAIIISTIFFQTKEVTWFGPAPCNRGNLGPCPRPWCRATTDRSTTQQLAKFRALQDPGDEGHGVGRGGGGHGRRPASGIRQEGRGQRDADKRTPTKLIFRS